MHSFEDLLEAAPYLEPTDLIPHLRGAQDPASLFRLRTLGDVDRALFASYEAATGLDSIIRSRHPDTGTWFSALNVVGGLKEGVSDPYLLVRSGFQASLPASSRLGLAYDVGGRVHAKYPDTSGLGNSGVVVAFPLLSYIGPISPRSKLKGLNTRLNSEARTAQRVLSGLANQSLAEAQAEWLSAHQKGLRNPMGGFGTSRRR